MASVEALLRRCEADPQWESEHVRGRPLRGLQAEIIQRLEKHILSKSGGVATTLCSRQVGKNDLAAWLQVRHLRRRAFAQNYSNWIRTAPTYKPQIVNSKKRLREILKLEPSGVIRHPLFMRQRIVKEEGYIWRLGNAAVEFVSSGPNAQVVGATASECLDMDEAHKVKKEKFDEDFAPFTASTNAATLLWGVAADGLDTIEWYRERNKEEGNDHLNLYYPCHVWMEAHPPYRAHVEGRVKYLGWDHPVIKTQYRLMKVAAEGKYLNEAHQRALFSGDHERLTAPRDGAQYQAMIDIAASNEEFNPEDVLEGEEDTATDSSVMWIYEVSPILASNGVFPIVRIVALYWFTGVSLTAQEAEFRQLIDFWRVGKCTVDAVGVGRQIAESLEETFGPSMINKYTATDKTVSDDCYDLQARLNYRSVLMFRNDDSPEYAEFARQVGWTKYASKNGKMKLVKPGAKKHIDMVKGLTYIHQNAPVGGVDEILAVESDWGDDG